MNNKQKASALRFYGFCVIYAAAVIIGALALYDVATHRIKLGEDRNTTDTIQVTFDAAPGFTIGDANGLPRCVLFAAPDGDFKTIQADNEIHVSSDMADLFKIKDVATENEYIVNLGNILVYQTKAGSTQARMENQLGPAKITCNFPDGKTRTGRADKICIHANGACEFMMGSNWYYTSLSRVLIEP